MIEDGNSIDTNDLHLLKQCFGIFVNVVDNMISVNWEHLLKHPFPNENIVVGICIDFNWIHSRKQKELYDCTFYIDKNKVF